jgi:hypothetical protein
MRRELFYVAASRGRESITVVTSDKELLRESVARSFARQSASELSRKAQEPSLEGLKPSLRERECCEHPATREQGHDPAQEVAGPSRKAPATERIQTIDRARPTREPEHDYVVETGHYHGISR